MHHPTYLAALGTERLLAHANADFDPLASTNLERELARRCEQLQDRLGEVQPLLDVLEDQGIDLADEREGLEALLEAAGSIGELDGAAKFLSVIKDRGFDGDERVLDGLLQVLDHYGITDPDELRSELAARA